MAGGLKLVVQNGKLAAISGERRHYACRCDVELLNRVRAKCDKFTYRTLRCATLGDWDIV